MSFYFPLPEVIKKTKAKYDCDKCKLSTSKSIRTPKFEAKVGEKYKGLVILGESPSREDDIRGTPFVNEEATTIRSYGLKNKINIANDAACLYAVSCCAGRKLSATHFKCCYENMNKKLLELKPKVIVCCGDMTFQSLFKLKEKISISKLRGRIIPNFEYNCLVYPVYDPKEIKGWYYRHAFEWDLEKIFNLWNEKFCSKKYIDETLIKRKILDGITINLIDSFDKLKALFNLLRNSPQFTLDYEATNAYPYDHWFEITHIGFAIKKTAWVIHENLWKNNSIIWSYIKRNMRFLLTSSNHNKICQNSMFEDQVSRFIFGIEKMINHDCTMLASHVAPDERRGTCSLDFQNLVRFGIPPYNETVKKYLEKENKDDKTNHIREAPFDDMILYSGLDCITTWHLIGKY
jgi:uracil-DNA glycosylase family 4